MAKCAKRRYRSEIDALIALSNAGNAHDGRAKAEVRHYRCPKCKGWHLTSKRVGHSKFRDARTRTNQQGDA
jgi:hypothetical protein